MPLYGQLEWIQYGPEDSPTHDVAAFSEMFASAVIVKCGGAGMIAQNGEYGVFAVFTRIFPQLVRFHLS